MKILGIETTCDETAASVVENGRRILSNVIFSQVNLHRRFHGVVPELASRAHMERIAFVIEQALRKAKKATKATEDKTQNSKLKTIDAVAFARGPGLPGALVVGSVAARTMARLMRAPLIGVNHLEGHLLACELSAAGFLNFPLIALIASGGHTELWIVEGYGRYRVLGRTRDDAAGEAFDKVSKLLGLGYPGGPAIERMSRRGNAGAIKFPRPYLPGSWDFSFSGLKTSVAYYVRDQKAEGRIQNKDIPDICASFQQAVADTLAVKAVQAARTFGIPRIAVGGGVARNAALRLKLLDMARGFGISVRFVEKRFCMDNAAMIAAAAYRMIARGGKIPKNSIAIDPDLEIKSWAPRPVRLRRRRMKGGAWDLRGVWGPCPNPPHKCGGIKTPTGMAVEGGALRRGWGKAVERI